ncbi:hypothetical protein FHU41_000015 [Psychromicrobium silvestre]|uniref:Periplasmic immunogenic protein n=1 Tax=Psychromicrobium silvestre TaxID=1645614 RepID=A0A7Y9LQM2_9MICC|nr:SIMPL domain-containing protein [Psychromicrobium silvestre]NYE93794.1 hypothetical protein [Psychromicrobium silvestre]
METSNTITVTGHGAASQAPDTLTLNIGVETVRASLTEAYQDAALSMRAVQSALDKLELDRKDSSTSGLSLRAETAWQEGKGNVTTGYNCSSTLTVRLSLQGVAEQAIAAIIEAGGDDVRLNGLQPSISDPAEVAEQARTLAWADAARNAAHFAELAGRSLGKVLEIAESQEHSPHPLERMDKVTFSAISMPIEAGESAVTASVRVTWELA